MAPPVLWQFRFSHFNEKARWALDFKGIPHVRRSLIPGLHLPRVLWLSGQKSLPVLQLDGETIVDSTRIIATLERLKPDPPLYPRNERERALALEDFFDEELGPYIRRALFHELLPDGDYCAALFSEGSGSAARTAYRIRLSRPGARAARGCGRRRPRRRRRGRGCRGSPWLLPRPGGRAPPRPRSRRPRWPRRPVLPRPRGRASAGRRAAPRRSGSRGPPTPVPRRRLG